MVEAVAVAHLLPEQAWLQRVVIAQGGHATHPAAQVRGAVADDHRAVESGQVDSGGDGLGTSGDQQAASVELARRLRIRVADVVGAFGVQAVPAEHLGAA